VIDMINVFDEFEINYQVWDPWADPLEVQNEYGLKTVSHVTELDKKFDAIVLAVAHDEFLQIDMTDFKKSESSVLYDIKSVLKQSIVDGRL